MAELLYQLFFQLSQEKYPYPALSLSAPLFREKIYLRGSFIFLRAGKNYL